MPIEAGSSKLQPGHVAKAQHRSIRTLTGIPKEAYQLWYDYLRPHTWTERIADWAVLMIGGNDSDQSLVWFQPKTSIILTTAAEALGAGHDRTSGKGLWRTTVRLKHAVSSQASGTACNRHSL
ncbi:MAG: hypothetical protein WB820_08575 [Rhodoplanes sp.]